MKRNNKDKEIQAAPKEKAPVKKRERRAIRTITSVLIMLLAYALCAGGLAWYLITEGVSPIGAAGALVTLLMAYIAFGLYLVIKHKDLRCCLSLY